MGLSKIRIASIGQGQTCKWSMGWSSTSGWAQMQFYVECWIDNVLLKAHCVSGIQPGQINLEPDMGSRDRDSTRHYECDMCTIHTLQVRNVSVASFMCESHDWTQYGHNSSGVFGTRLLDVVWTTMGPVIILCLVSIQGFSGPLGGHLVVHLVVH